MGTKPVRQTTFTTGEVDINTWKRTDIEAAYLSAAQSLKNMEVGTTGLCRKRKGTRALLNVSTCAIPTSCLFEFRDKFGNYYIIMLGQQQACIFSAPSDTVQVVTSRGNNVITARGANVVVNNESITEIGSPLVLPYNAVDLPAIDYTQDNDVLILTHPNYQPGRIYISDYTTSPYTFAFEYLNISPLPAYDFGNINYNNFTVAYSISGSTLTFQFTGLGSDPGFDNDWIGGQLIGPGNSVNAPIGVALITAVSYSAGTTTFTATIQVPWLASGYSTSGSQYVVKQPAWSDKLGYPAKTVFYQNRLWLANTYSLNGGIFGSKINAPLNFDVGAGNDTDAIVYNVGINDSGSILWLNGGKQLEIYMENFECACPQDQNAAITPSTFSVKQQASYGVSPFCKPVAYLNDSYYLSKTGKAIINFKFNGVGLRYDAKNISAASQHLVKNPVNRALIRGDDSSQDNFIYFLNPDETLTSFQFAHEYKLAALTPVEFQSNTQDDPVIEIVDIVAVNNELYILKYYSLTQVFYIEHMVQDIKVDSARVLNMASSGVVTGLDDLDGYTVQVIYEGQDFGQYLVAGGQITVFNPEGFANDVIVGLLYENRVRPMYVFAGAMASPFFKQITRIYVDYQDSLNFYINGSLVQYQNFAQIQAGMPLTPQTDTAIYDPVMGWDRFATFEITQNSPFDLQILGIEYQIDTAVL